MRFREIKCDGFRNPANTQLTQKRSRSKEWFLPQIVWTEAFHSLARKGRETHGEPGTIHLGGEKGQEQDLITADGLPSGTGSRWKLNVWEESIGRQIVSQYEEGN